MDDPKLIRPRAIKFDRASVPGWETVYKTITVFGGKISPICPFHVCNKMSLFLGQRHHSRQKHPLEASALDTSFSVSEMAEKMNARSTFMSTQNVTSWIIEFSCKWCLTHL